MSGELKTSEQTTFSFEHTNFIDNLIVFFLFLKVDAMYSLFKSNAEHPPVYKNHPPVAGAVGWERSLFYRIKRTILRFQEMEDMLNSDQGKVVSILCHIYDLFWWPGG